MQHNISISENGSHDGSSSRLKTTKKEPVLSSNAQICLSVYAVCLLGVLATVTFTIYPLFSNGGPDPCQDGGSCINGATCYNYNQTSYYCLCLPAFTGINCETDIEECASSPCINGGTCVQWSDGYDGYTCRCRPGFTGINCQTDINECTSEPCLHGGTCMDDINHFICQCPLGYTGQLCETDIQECTSELCFHGGTCLDDTNSITCQCPLGYTGRLCETEIDECSIQPCQNQGTCTDKINGYSCTCLDGYTGNDCETDIDDCKSNPCLNGATCMDEINDYTCHCPVLYSGENCESELKSCKDGPCNNGATCTDETGEIVCQCAPGFTGIACETDIDECESQPCENGGTCIDELLGYHCKCDPWSTGILCEIDLCTLLIQQHIRDSIEKGFFNKSWDAMLETMDNKENFWLGLKYIREYVVRGEGKHKLLINLTGTTGEKYYAKYDIFSIGDEASNFKLTVGGFSSSELKITDELQKHNDQQFSTFDRDNDQNSGVNMADVTAGGWWINVTCAGACLYAENGFGWGSIGLAESQMYLICPRYKQTLYE